MSTPTKWRPSKRLTTSGVAHVILSQLTYDWQGMGYTFWAYAPTEPGWRIAHGRTAADSDFVWLISDKVWSFGRAVDKAMIDRETGRVIHLSYSLAPEREQIAA